MFCESGGDPDAVGAPNANGTRDYGLMQLNPKGALSAWTANGHPTRDPMNPEHALEVGAWFVGRCIPAWLRQLGQPVTRDNIVVSYNAGAGAVKSGRIPASTRAYLAKVGRRYASSAFAADATATVPARPARSGTASVAVVRWLGGVGLALSALWSAFKLLRQHD